MKMDVQKTAEKKPRDKKMTSKERCLLAEKTIHFKNDFLVHLSHDMRNSLAALQGFSGLMYSGEFGPVSPKHKEFLVDILSCSEHLLQLIDVLRCSANIESCQEPIDMNKLIDALKSSEKS